jgi:hypothetical protein
VTHSSSFVRKVAYIVAMALLLIPIAVMSLPATVRRDVQDRPERQPGGVLAEMHYQAGLSQAQLGEIDPASETMKLATFGLRGIAVVWLWDKSNEYKKKEDWDNLSATLEQIARLEPNFIAVWEHQAHNISYNVSVEFDDYRQRYHWVKKGIDYLIDGTEFNRNEPRLLWFTGWVVGHKIGRADERVQFRRLYREDQELHEVFAHQGIDMQATRGPDRKPDNWLTAREWYLESIQAHRDGGSIGGKSPVLFFSSPVMSLVNFAGDLEKDPDFEEDFLRAKWTQAYEEWVKLGNIPLASSYGFTIQLNEVDSLQAKIKEKEAELDALLPGVRDEVREKKKAGLSTELRRALERPQNELDMATLNQSYQAKAMIEPTYLEIAGRAPPDKAVEARRLANTLSNLQQRMSLTRTSRQIVNFDFWRERSQAGATEINTAARKHLFEARQLFAKPDLEGAKAKFEQSFKEWAEIFAKWPTQKDDTDNDDLVAAVETYIKVLEQLDLRDAEGGILPTDFPLTELMQANNKENLLKFRKEDKPQEESKPDDEKTTPEEEKKPAEEKLPDDAKAATPDTDSGNKKANPEQEKADQVN